MGIAAGLFHSFDSEVETLHRRIMPTEEQREEQTERWNELRDFLVEHIKEMTGFSVRSWLQGSYKFGTQIRPRHDEEFDIDLGVYLEWVGDPEDKMTAKDLKQYIQDAVEAYGNQNIVKDVLRPAKERCSRVIYDGNFHIDVPSYHLDPERDLRSLATETNGWEDSDPKALVKWFRENAGDDEERSQLRRIVRYLKCWAMIKFELDSRPSSILITVLATDAYRDIPEDVEGDDDALLAILNGLRARLEKDDHVINPVSDPKHPENLNRLGKNEFQALLNGLRDFEKVARNAVAASTKFEAADYWAEAFTHFFPMPEEEINLQEGRALVAIPQPEIQLFAREQTAPYRTYSGRNSIGPIPKDCDLRFQIVGNVPQGITVQWTVRNGRGEAEDFNDLGHRNNDTGITTTEHSAYNGKHSMDCTMRDCLGRVVGFRRVPVTVTDGMARNPKKKPGYVKLRGMSR